MHETLLSLMTVLIAFFVVIALIFLTRYGLNFFEPYLKARRKNSDLSVIDTLSLDPKRRIQVVRYKDDIALFLTGGQNDIFLGWRHQVCEGDKKNHISATASSSQGKV